MGLDLADTGTPSLSWRRLRVLIGQLVRRPDSNTSRSMAGKHGDWPLPVAIQARTLYALEVANWQRTVMNWDEKKYGRPPLPPDPIGPDSTTSKPREVTAEALVEFNNRAQRKAVA